MRILFGILLASQCILFHAFAGDFDPNGVLQPTLEERVRDSDLIVLTSVETRHGFIAYKILETWKGVYNPKNFPDQYKGYFTSYVRPKDYYQHNPKHGFEIRFSGKGSNIVSPAQSQPNPSAIYFNPSTIYPNLFQLPVIENTVNYPLRIRGGDEVVLDKQAYSLPEIKTLIQKLVKKQSG